MALPVSGLVGRFLGTTIATGAGFAFGRAAGPVLAPPLQALRNEVNEKYAFVPLSPDAAAQAWLIGAPVPNGWEREAARSGTNKMRWEAIRAMAGGAPSWDQLRTLWNRGRIDVGDVNDGLAQNGIRPEWRDHLRQLRWTVPSAGELAQMAAQGIIPYDTARDTAVNANADGTTFDRLYRLAARVPDSAELLNLRNRGAIDDGELAAGLRKQGLTGDWIGRVASLRRYLLPPSDVIRLAVHEVYSPARRSALNLDAEFPAEFAAKAAQLGISEDDARDLWAGHWDLPSYSQLSEMLFRTDMDSAEFRDSLAAIDIAPKWRARFEQIARRIPTMSDFQRLARREVFNPAQRKALQLDAEFPEAFATKAALHGMTRADAEDLWAGGWRLPSAGQGYRMLWRKLIGEGELRDLLKALDYAPTWRDKLAEIARPTLGRIDIRRALAAGELTPAEGRARYERIGLTPDDAALMVRLASTPASSNVRELTAQQLADSFEAGYITEAEYGAELDELGFAPEDLARYRQLGNVKRVNAARRQTLATIRTAYVSHRLQPDEARARLDAEGLPADTAERIWQEWTEQKGANVKVLTPTQIKKAYGNSQITEADAIAELVTRGMRERDARRLLNL